MKHRKCPKLRSRIALSHQHIMYAKVFFSFLAGCPAGYYQVGTLSSNNDIMGRGLGQSYDSKTIDGCEAKCENHSKCVAFMFDDKSFKCELSATRKPNNSWGTNFRFCASDEGNFLFCLCGILKIQFPNYFGSINLNLTLVLC